MPSPKSIKKKVYIGICECDIKAPIIYKNKYITIVSL